MSIINYFISILLSFYNFMFEKLKKLFSKKNKKIKEEKDKEDKDKEKEDKEIIPLTLEERQRIAQIRVEKFKDDPLLQKIKREHKKQDEDEKNELMKKLNKENKESSITAIDWLRD